MKKIYYFIVLVALVLLSGSCSDDGSYLEETPDKQVVLKLFQEEAARSRTVDADNTEEEQTINNISVFFTEPSSDVITHKFVHSGFTRVDDYRLIVLPLDPATLQTKDIYVIANYDNTNALDAIQSTNDLKTLTTPKVNKTQHLLPGNGIVMYGSTDGFNFNSGTNATAIVNIVRTYAKIRLSLTFPENAKLSTNNSFLIQDAATYTYVVRNDQMSLSPNDYFTYAASVPLTDNGNQAYINTTYIYESTRAPRLYIYTYINNSATQQEYSVDLPVPYRNYLYDIKIEIYEATTKNRTRSDEAGELHYNTQIKIYDEKGNWVFANPSDKYH